MTTKILDKSKKIGNYKINFKASFKKAEDDHITLVISYADDLRDFLKSVCIVKEEVMQFIIPNNSYREENGSITQVNNNINRYRVKKWLMNALYSNYKGLIFAKELIDTGKMEIKLCSVGKIDEIVNELKETIGQAIYNIQKYEDFETTVTYDVKVKVTE